MADTTYIPTARTASGATPLRDGPASNAALERGASDDQRYLRDATLTSLEWSRNLSVEPLGSLTAFTVNVGGISNVTLRDADDTFYYVKAYGGGGLGASKIEGGGGTLGAVARWWYLYAFLNGTALDFEFSLTGPNVTRKLKSGAATRRYLGCFPTTGAGAPIPLVAQGGLYTYLDGVLPGISDLQSDSGWHNLSLAAGVPPHVRLATLTVTMDAGASFRCIGAPTGLGDNQLARPLVLDASQRIEWNANGSARGIDATVHGFMEG